jgi:hypothetical protein
VLLPLNVVEPDYSNISQLVIGVIDGPKNNRIRPLMRGLPA